MSDLKNRGIAGQKRKKLKIDWVCVNPQCIKSKSDEVVTAKPFIIAYYGAKIDEKRKRKVCMSCYVDAKVSLNKITRKIESKESFYEEPLPIIKETAVVLDDSDEEEGAKTDSSIESDMEFELEDSQNVEDLIQATINKLGIPKQIDGAIENLSSRLDALNSDAADIDSSFLALEKQVDELRASLYAPFKPELSHKGSIDINDVQGSGDIVTSSFDPTLVPLPPIGPLKRTVLIQGEKVIAMKGKDILSVWDEASIHEIFHQTGLVDNNLPYKVKFEDFVDGKLRSTFYKRLGLKHIAYFKPATIRLQVGTRVIAVYIDPSNETNKDFYSGIIAEPPKTMNRHRYLVFFDDGYASYIKHEDIRVVCAQTENAVYEDIHPNSRDFVRKYLLQYPERPMVKLGTGQHVSVECGGTWWNAKVEDIDGSLVRVSFSVNGRREAIYRGSARLLPLFKQMQQQKKNAEGSNNKHFARRNHANKYRSQIEYTRNADDDFTTPGGATAANSGAPAEGQVKRPTARKSTTSAAKKNDPKTSKPDPNRVRWESKGKVAAIEVECAEGIKFEKHQCKKLCMDDQKYTYDPEKFVSKEEKLKNFNPILIPVILGWKRQCTKHKNMGKRSIYYVSPCGRRLRNLEEVHRYLRVTHSTLEIDFFNFEWYVHVFNHFTPERKFYKIDDISYGKENAPVSCVNSLDNDYPEYVEYSTVRLPQKNVNIPLDEGFLTCCDCDDGCQDKQKCSCWQLTIQTTAASNPDAQVNANAGYEFRRLMEGVPTGIYECNKFCKCNNTCLNRVAQNPIRIPLQVFKTDRRGWGIRTLCDIPRGGFICIYVGNLYTNEEANKQGQDFGDEYFAELDLIEVVEGRKEGYESDCEGDVGVLSEDEQYKPGLSASSEDEDNDIYKDNEKEDKNFKLKHSEKKMILDANLGSQASDASSTRQTRQKKAARNNSESSNGNDSELGKGKKDSRPDSAENKTKFVSTRKYFHKGGDFYVMDAKSIGNIGRYLNHSCNPNVFVQNCFVDTHDLRFPWVGFFSQSHITAGEELCWDYNYQVDQVAGKEIYCRCGSESCRGRLL